nr:reverse transcriptase domain-containing protein [Tanacetum cinerariifolium]
MREVYYHDWLSNPVMVKKHGGSWRMCVDLMDLNRACLQDCYPLPEIDWKVESLCDVSQAAPTTAAQKEPWTLFTDGSSCVDGSGAGLILTNPEGVEFTYALRFQFAASNNEAEYEALVAGLRIATQMGVKIYRMPGEYGARHKDSNFETVSSIGAHFYNRGSGALDLFRQTKYYERFMRVHAALFQRAGEGQVPDNRNGLLHEVGRTKAVATITGRQVKSLREGIKARLGEGNKNWVEELPHVLWAHRTMIKSSHGDTPFSLTYGTEAVIPAEIRMPTYRTTSVDMVNNDKELRLNLDLLEERHERATICEANAKSKMMKYYNARVRGVAFKPGDFVYRSNDASHAVAGGKLGPKWDGPYEVTEALGNRAYKLRSTDGTVLPRTWNITNLKRCYL